MADTKNTGVPDEASQGLVFKDGPGDMARLARYEDYLRLQARSDGMSDEQYLAELDKIMESGDGFDEADTRYGTEDKAAAIDQTDDTEADRKETIARAERLRMNLENDGDPIDRSNGNAFLLDAETEQTGEPNQASVSGTELGRDGASLERNFRSEFDADGHVIPVDVDGREAELKTDAPDLTDEAELPDMDEPSEDPEAALLEEGSYLGADMIIHDELEDENEPDRDPEREAKGAAAPDMPAGPGAVIQDDEPEDGIGSKQAGLEAAAADTPEAVAAANAGLTPENAGQQVQAEPGYVPEPDAVTQAPESEGLGLVPEGPAASNAAAARAMDQPEPQVGAGAMPCSIQVPGHLSVHEEEFETTDFLDELSVATGLASSIQTAEYIPPREVQIVYHEAPQASERSPKMKELFLQRQIDRMKEEEFGIGSSRQGPSGPGL